MNIPGPWTWRVNRGGHSVALVSSKGLYVMSFGRWGMRSASPAFQADGLMVRADSLAVTIPGQEHNASWNMTLNHPDATLIAAAPDLLAACEAVLQSVGDDFAERSVRELLVAAVEKAKG
jgi:hypothetical protein